MATEVRQREDLLLWQLSLLPAHISSAKAEHCKKTHNLCPSFRNQNDFARFFGIWMKQNELF